MSDLLAPRFRRVFEYERDTHSKILTALEDVPEELRSGDDFGRAVDLFAHVVAARMTWLHRLGVLETRPQLFPEGVALADLGERLTRMHEEWSRYLAGLTDDDVQTNFEYESYEGDRYRNSVEEILTQLYGHSLYHGGQIASRLRALGCTPPPTDFVLWSRIQLD